MATDLPEGGLAAASTEVRDFSMVVMPALAMEMVCCSMACTQHPSLVNTIQTSKWMADVWRMCKFVSRQCLLACSSGVPGLHHREASVLKTTLFEERPSQYLPAAYHVLMDTAAKQRQGS